MIKKFTFCAIMLLFATFNGFSQTYDIKISNDSRDVEITFKPYCGGGDSVVIPVTFRENKADSTYTLTFKKGKQSKYLYFFGDNHSLKTLKKSYSNIWFDKKLIKDSKKKLNIKTVKKYCNSIVDKYKDETFLCFNMFEENDIKITVGKKWDGVLNVYIAVKSNKKRERQILYLAEVKFNISVTETICDTKIVQDKIAEMTTIWNKLKKETAEIEAGVTNCETYNRLKDSGKKQKYSEGNCSACSKCKDFTNAKANLNKKIDEYNELIKTALKQKSPCPPSKTTCNCNCNKLNDIYENQAGPLLTKLQAGLINKSDAKKEFEKIQKLPCTGSGCEDKTCESECDKCSNYKNFKKVCEQIQKKLNE